MKIKLALITGFLFSFAASSFNKAYALSIFDKSTFVFGQDFIAAAMHDVKNDVILGGGIAPIWKLWHVSVDVAVDGAPGIFGAGPSATIYVFEIMNEWPAYHNLVGNSFLNTGFLQYVTVGGFFIRDWQAGVYREGYWLGPKIPFGGK